MFAPSLALAAATPAAAADGPWIDTTDRAAVLEAYTQEFDRVEPDMGYTGNAASCTAGTTSQAFRNSVIQRVNWYRRMAGLPTVSERSGYTTAAQQSSTMMAAQGQLSHGPGSGYACYTSSGATAASKSNLALGVSGIGAIDAYVRDPGGNNLSVGHRRTMLYPQLRDVGTGDTAASNGYHAANTLYVFDDNIWSTRPAIRETRGFVAWPPSGYVPPDTVWGRWSFSLAGGDFSNATVSVRDSLGLIQTTVLDRIQPDNPNSRIAPEPAIVWAVGADSDSTLLPAPTNGDECYDISIGGVKVGGAVQSAYNYTTCVLDPDFDSASAPSRFVSTSNGECDSITFDVWAVPCWTDGGSLAGFTDITAAWQREPVAWLVVNGVTTGVSPTRYDPDASLTRAQAATLIWRLVGSPTPPPESPTFADVSSSAYYSDAVRWMARYGVTTGTGAGRFSPDAPATRAEFVTFLWRLIDEPVVNAPVPFTDLTASWQMPSVKWAARAEITTGTSATTFSPDSTVTRGQAAALLARFGDAVS